MSNLAHSDAEAKLCFTWIMDTVLTEFSLGWELT